MPSRLAPRMAAASSPSVRRMALTFSSVGPVSFQSSPDSPRSPYESAITLAVPPLCVTVAIADTRRVPTSHGRTILLSRDTQPETELQLLLNQLKLQLPDQPPPRITAAGHLSP